MIIIFFICQSNILVAYLHYILFFLNFILSFYSTSSIVGFEHLKMILLDKVSSFWNENKNLY